MAGRGVLPFKKALGPWRSGYDERAPSTIPEDALTAAYNCRVAWPSATVGPRPGTQRVAVSALPAAVLGGTVWTVQIRHALVCADGNLKTTVAANIDPPSPWTSTAGSFSTANTPQFAEFYDAVGTAVLYIADGAGKVSKWDGTTLTMRVAATTPATVYRIAVYNQRLWACSGADSTLYFSGLGNGDSLGDTANGGGSIIVRPVNGAKMIGLLAVGQTLFLFFENSIGRFTGWSQDDFDLEAGVRGLSATVGLRSVAMLPMAAENSKGFFGGNDGEFYEITELGISIISAPLENLRHSQGSVTQGCIGVWPHRGEVWFVTSNGTYVWNYRMGVWAGLWSSAFAYTTTNTGSVWGYLAGNKERMFAAGVQNGGSAQFYLADSGVNTGAGLRIFGLDDVDTAGGGGSAIVARAAMRPLSVGTPLATLATRYVDAYLSNQSAGVSIDCYETMGIVDNTGQAVGSKSVQTKIGSTGAGPFDTPTGRQPEYTAIRFPGQANANSVLPSFVFLVGGATYNDVGEQALSNLLIEGVVYPGRQSATLSQ